MIVDKYKIIIIIYKGCVNQVITKIFIDRYKIIIESVNMRHVFSDNKRPSQEVECVRT